MSTTEKAKSFARHIPALDGVRGLAILLVVAYHLMSSSPNANNTILRCLAALRASLWIGVDIFFALSGFLITGILFDTLENNAFFKTFYARRFLRIFPLYYGVIFVLLILSKPLHIAWHGSQYVLFGYLQNTGAWIGKSIPLKVEELTGHFWSLAVEEQFYLVWPLLVFWVRDRRKLMRIAVVLSFMALVLRTFLVLHGASLDWTYKMTLCRMDSLLIGGWLALSLRGDGRDSVLKAAKLVFPVLVITLVGAGIICGNFDKQSNEFVNTIGYSLLAIASTALIACVLQEKSWAELIFRNQMLRWFGRYSYGIYVLHLIVGYFIGLGPRQYLDAHFHSKAVGVAFGGVPTFLISIALAFVSYHLFEVKFLKLKKYFDYSDRKTKAVLVLQ
ncbi:MAG: acyltransferase family protein [Acidobacteriaceae bacterium]